MPTLTRFHAPVPFYLAQLLQRMGLNKKQSQTLWDMFSRSVNPKISALRYRLMEFNAKLPTAKEHEIQRFMDGTMSPQSLVLALEKCFDEGLLQRDIATQLEGVLLSWVRQGKWK